MGKLGDEIKRLRGELGLSQKALAERVGVAQPSLWRIEAAGGGIDGATLYRLCDALGVPCDHFRELVLSNPPREPSPLMKTITGGVEGPADANRPGPPPEPVAPPPAPRPKAMGKRK